MHAGPRLHCRWKICLRQPVRREKTEKLACSRAHDREGVVQSPPPHGRGPNYLRFSTSTSLNDSLPNVASTLPAESLSPPKQRCVGLISVSGIEASTGIQRPSITTSFQAWPPNA